MKSFLVSATVSLELDFEIEAMCEPGFPGSLIEAPEPYELSDHKITAITVRGKDGRRIVLLSRDRFGVSLDELINNIFNAENTDLGEIIDEQLFDAAD